ncbi:hypothetical protein PHYPSEUDO_003790 [Phytophthora pseudosyringae]|uniref:Uncharacterized protein n=1 Tax=Phytophthora pseudosyringae TaxID=221518 RepID=A0A8T1WES6_9STRA|nr:hypothetical protein PHYPSEUDO_003790 [Phytophthora pseudosyringae]
MGLLKRHALLGTIVFLAAVHTVQAAAFELEATVLYDAKSVCLDTSSAPVYVTAIPASACTASSACVQTSTGTFPATICSVTDGTGNGDFIQTTLPYLFGSSPYVVLERYAVAKSCATGVAKISVYLADGKCHKTDSGSYIATRKTDGSSMVKVFEDSACATTTGTTVLTVTAAQATGNSCASDGNGIVDAKVYGSGETATPLYLSSTMNYDSYMGGCKSPVVATMVATSVVAANTCADTTVCAGTVDPFTRTSCSSTLTYKDDMAATFGSSPYVIVEKYTAGYSCDATKLAGITTYLADNKCHRTGSSAGYTATRAADGSAVIRTYTDAHCASGKVILLSVTAVQAAGNSCRAGADGILDTKVFGVGGDTPLYFSSAVSYDTNTYNCKPPGVPTQLMASVVPVDGCTPTTACSGTAAPFTGTLCSSGLTFTDDVAAAFGSNPYVIVETYPTGMNCAVAALSSTTTYLADGKCHKTGASMSYRVTRMVDGSAVIKRYTDTGCEAGGLISEVTAVQVSDNLCSTDPNDNHDTKVYGSGETPLYLKSLVGYETTTGACEPPVVPIQVSTSVTMPDTCVATTSCSGSGPLYFRSTCSTTSTYKTDLAVMFEENTYIIVERYTSGKSCNSRELTSITTFLADGKCHETGTATSYNATRNWDGASTITLFTDSMCATGASTLAVTAAQAAGNSCATGATGIIDAKVYGNGGIQQHFSTIATYDTSVGGCKAPMIPTQLFTTIVAEGACMASSSCVGTASPYNGTLCSSTSNYQKEVAAVLGAHPHVIVEKYAAGKSCEMAELSDIRTFIADTKCHRASSTTSFRAIRKADGSSTIMTYANSGSCSRGPETFAATTAQARRNSCKQGATGVVDTKLYGGGATPLFLSVTAIYATTAYDCSDWAQPVQWVATTLSVDACVPSVGCRYSGASSYTRTVCSNTRTYEEDMTVAFNWTDLVTVESYIPGKDCAQSALASVVTYLVDGWCHASSSTASFRATNTMEGSARIDIYTSSSSCGYESSTLAVTADQVNGNECVSTGFADIKVYSRSS